MIKIIKQALTEYDPRIDEWDDPVIRNFNGKKVVGRPTKAYGTKCFEYAGKTYKPEPWTLSMEILKQAAEFIVFKQLDQVIKFNFCLCGLYKDGSVSIPHHSDTVPTKKDLVLGVSYGASRYMEWNQYRYDIKEHTNTSEVDINEEWSLQKTYLLNNGDVYIFDGESQMSSTHAILPSQEAGERINLTFRTGI